MFLKLALISALVSSSVAWRPQYGPERDTFIRANQVRKRYQHARPIVRPADAALTQMDTFPHSPSQGNFSALAEFVSDHSGVVVASVFNLKFAEVAAVGLYGVYPKLYVWSLVSWHECLEMCARIFIQIQHCWRSRCSTAWQEILHSCRDPDAALHGRRSSTSGWKSRCSTAWQEISDFRPCMQAFANFNHV